MKSLSLSSLTDFLSAWQGQKYEKIVRRFKFEIKFYIFPQKNT